MCLHTMLLSITVPELDNLQCDNQAMHYIKIFA